LSEVARADAPRPGPVRPPHPWLSPEATYWGVVLAIEAVVVTHPLWREPGNIVVGAIWAGGVFPLFRRFGKAAAAGVVVGEAVANALAVPPALTSLCMGDNRFDVGTMFMLRWMVIGLALVGWRGARGTVSRWGERLAFLGGVLVLVSFGAMSYDDSVLLLGHRSHRHVEAEERVRARLGPEYADYQLYCRDLEEGFLPAGGVVVRASIFVYDSAAHDAFERSVEWTEPPVPR
jgi:hypothetical protein